MAAFYVKFVKSLLAFFMMFNSVLGMSDTITVPKQKEIAKDADVRVVQFNLRCTGTGKTSIAYRAPLLVADIKTIGADSMGFQEANQRWMGYLESQLTDYAYVGVGRSSGSVTGEYSPVFYLKDKYDAVDSGTFWLSKTPDKAGSKDWGSACKRICTWVILKNKETGLTYAHFNTHLDHISSLARENQMKVILEKIEEYAPDMPVVLTGDFNDYNDSEMYSIATSSLRDSRLIAPVTEDKITYHNYGSANSLIDYVFVNDKVTPLVYHVIDDKIDDTYLSDHYGIYVDAKIG